MVERRNWACTILYLIGIAGLACSVLALAGVTWSAGAWSEKMLFDAFCASLSIAVAAFTLACIVEVAVIVVRTPDPKDLRTNAPAASRVNRAEIEHARERIARAA